MRSKYWLLISALLVASLLPAVVLGLVSASLKVIPFTFLIALVHAVVLCVPLVAILWRKNRITAINSIVAGFGIGGAFVAVVTWPFLFSGMNSSASVNGVETIINGVPTAAGWLQYVKGIIYLGLFGAMGGLAFWCWLKLFRGLPDDYIGTKRAASTMGSSAPVVAAVIATIAVLLIPSATKDRSCHNVLRDGRTSIGPVLMIDLDISEADWPDLQELYADLASARGLEFRDSSKHRPGVSNLLYLSACEDGFTIMTNEQRWSRANSKVLLPQITGRGVGISVFEINSGSNWTAVAIELVDHLERRWPDKVRFRDGGGKITPKPARISLD
ncbi:MAG: hypothetical protein AAF699_16695 [Pseudomonadota bacterium]